MIREMVLKTVVKAKLMQENAFNNAKAKINNQTGLAATEYALVMAIIVVGILGAATLMFEPLQQFFKDAVSKVQELLG